MLVKEELEYSNDFEVFSEKKLRVVILEDSYYALVGLTALLEKDGIEVVGTSDEVEPFLSLVRDKQPDLAIVDLKIRNQFVGVEVIRKIKNNSPSVKCIVETVYIDNITYFIQAMDAGAEGFIWKDSTEKRELPLGQIVKMVATNGKYYSPDILEKILPHMG